MTYTELLTQTYTIANIGKVSTVFRRLGHDIAVHRLAQRSIRSDAVGATFCFKWT